MATTTWAYGQQGSGLHFTLVYDTERGLTVTMLEGKMDLNAIYVSDGDRTFDGAPGALKLPKCQSALNMKGSGEVWDDMVFLNGAGLRGRDQANYFLQAGVDGRDSYTLTNAQLADLLGSDIPSDLSALTMGVRATSVNGCGSIKAVMSDAVYDDGGQPPTDDWADGYNDWDGRNEFMGIGSMPAGDVGLDGKIAATGVIEVDGDTDLFVYRNEFGSSQSWWNGVYEITVTGALDTSKLTLGLESSFSETPVVTDAATRVDFDIIDGDTIVLAQDWNLSGSNYFQQDGFFTPAGPVNLKVGAIAGATGSYSVSVNMIDDYSDTIDPDDVADTTADLGLGTILKTTLGGVPKSAGGLINYAGDADVWKYEGTNGELVSVRFKNPENEVTGNLTLQVFDSAGNEITGNNGVYTLDGTAHIKVTGAAAGSNYSLEVAETEPPVQPGGDFYISVGRLDDKASAFGAWFDTDQDGVRDEGEVEIATTPVINLDPELDFGSVSHYSLDTIDFSTGDYTIRFVDMVTHDGASVVPRVDDSSANVGLKIEGFGDTDRIIVDMLTNSSDWMGLAGLIKDGREVVPTTPPDFALTGDQDRLPDNQFFKPLADGVEINGALTPVTLDGAYGWLTSGSPPVQTNSQFDYTLVEARTAQRYNPFSFADQAAFDAAVPDPTYTVEVRAVAWVPNVDGDQGGQVGFAGGSLVTVVGVPLDGTNVQYLVPAFG